MCRALRNELESSSNLADALGPTEATDGYLVGVLKLISLFDECQQHRRHIRDAAISLGIEGEKWGALVRGESSLTAGARSIDPPL